MCSISLLSTAEQYMHIVVETVLIMSKSIMLDCLVLIYHKLFVSTLPKSMIHF